MPMNSAITIAGIGTARATSGARATAAIATSAESAKPGKTLRVACIVLNRAALIRRQGRQRQHARIPDAVPSTPDDRLDDGAEDWPTEANLSGNIILILGCTECNYRRTGRRFHQVAKLERPFGTSRFDRYENAVDLDTAQAEGKQQALVVDDPTRRVAHVGNGVDGTFGAHDLPVGRERGAQ